MQWLNYTCLTMQAAQQGIAELDQPRVVGEKKFKSTRFDLEHAIVPAVTHSVHRVPMNTD
jgi:hypothetical protein